MKKILFIMLIFPVVLSAQTLSTEIKNNIGDYLNQLAKKEISVGKIKIDSVTVTKKEINIFANINASYIPFREENVKRIYEDVSKMLPADFSNKKLIIFTDKKPIEQLVPTYYRAKPNKKGKTFVTKTKTPLVNRIFSLNSPEKGLKNRHIALWQSHGLYFNQQLNRWEWQRARIFETVEDLYTQSYVLPFLVPMLENAGANVLLPRERDYQKEEIIIDNDDVQTQLTSYEEKNGDEDWKNTNFQGFANKQKQYFDFQNPFKTGTCRQVKTIKKGKISTAEWTPFISKSGNYAVYVSYQSIKNSAEDALYTVYHSGGISQFKVNQTMGGGTWIYLGNFYFKEGKRVYQKVTLNNYSSQSGKVLTADGIKLGGGIGNIARRTSAVITENVKSSDTTGVVQEIKQIPQNNFYQTSGYPRFTEAARYWMQWAGIPESIYSESNGKNDYTDDYKSRGRWVNYLCGGSVINKREAGLHIPIDMSFAFHTDAGITPNDSIIGTLGIFFTNLNNGLYENGVSRYAARELTDLIQSQIVKDVRILHEPNWSRRGMWNQSYFEARVPKTPTMLLELLSHQNFADMRYGLDPRFRFTVSRAIYKGILRFIASQNKSKYVVQPLPVDNLSLKFTSGNEVELTWKPVTDPLERSAAPEKYIVYKRVGNNGFDNGTLISTTAYKTTVPSNIICSFKVTAVNAGGESFPSEILSAGKSSEEKNTVLVINGFDRISAPADFSTDSTGGFLDDIDHGVPYINDYKYTGRQKEFDRKKTYINNDVTGFGDSYKNYEGAVIAGNTFDYPAVHGAAILKAGYSFVSCSDEAVENKLVKLSDYKIVDLILGKECQTKIGRGVKPLEFKTFSQSMQNAVSDYCLRGGNVFTSGAYVASDLWNNPLTASLESDRKFAEDILKYKLQQSRAAKDGKIKSAVSIFPEFSGNFTYYNELNEESYVVESPDAIEPADENTHSVFQYSENNLSAGIVFSGRYKTCVLGFPFESIKTTEAREKIMKAVLKFFE